MESVIFNDKLLRHYIGILEISHGHGIHDKHNMSDDRMEYLQ